jgi:uncharacterized protein (DUF1015 family)
MAVTKAFRGVRYNPERIDDLSLVISQPYDRVRHGLQEKYYAQSDHTIVKIIKGRELETDSDDDNVYTRARDYLGAWLDEGVLMREDIPALYVLHQTFTLPDGQKYTRKAFTTALQITTFDEGTVLPHERTLSGPKVDRLNLARATETYFGSIFMLYPDEENRVNSIVDQAVQALTPAVARELFENDVEQRFWVVRDPAVIAQVEAEMAPKVNLIIADGHHRYETAINYRDEMRAKYPDAPPNAGFNYRMVSLVSMSDPSLVILPTHRLIQSYTAKTSKQVIEDAGAYFDVMTVPDREGLEAALADATPDAPRIGFYDGDYAVFTLRNAQVMAEITPDRDPTWQMLDVSILHEVLIERVMGLSKESIERKENIDYLRDVGMGYGQVDQGEADFVFVMNPTRMDQVRDCTTTGAKMPQKSTDFYPKIISGLVAMPVGPDERL